MNVVLSSRVLGVFCQSNVRGVSVKLDSEELNVRSAFCLAVGKPSLCYFAYFVRLAVVSLCIMYIVNHLGVSALGKYHLENNTSQTKFNKN